MGEAVENGAQGSILAGMDIASGKNLVALMKPDAATHNAHLAYLGYEKQWVVEHIPGINSEAKTSELNTIIRELHHERIGGHSHERVAGYNISVSEQLQVAC